MKFYPLEQNSSKTLAAFVKISPSALYTAENTRLL